MAPMPPVNPAWPIRAMREVRGVPGRFFALILLGLLFQAIPGLARVNVVTLPARDSVQLTIYNSVDLTLVKETRHLTFKRGLNRLEFSWANTLIDPTSVEFQPLTHADAVEVLDVSFPPRVANTLEWRINSEFAGEVQVEIRYFTSGVSWNAEYAIEANPSEQQGTLQGHVRVRNNSGEDYEQAQVRLVVGVIRLVEEIAELARARSLERGGVTNVARFQQKEMLALDREFKLADKDAKKQPREIIKEGLSEYFLFTVEGRDTIPNGWSKRLPSFRAADIPIESYYKFETERWQHQAVRFYKFRNDEPSRLGREPLPDGRVTAFRLLNDSGNYAFVGRTEIKYVPVNEAVELEFGPDQEVRVEPRLMDWQKVDLRFDPQGNVTGWTTREQWALELQNSRPNAITLDIRRTIQGDWSFSSPVAYEKVDAQKVKFLLKLGSREKQMIRYEVVTRHGTNATR